MESHKKSRQLEALYERIRSDPNYRNEAMGTIFVPGKGTLEEGALVFIGEAPGREEEKARQPFVGPAGRNFNELLHGIGLSRKQVFVTNLVKYRPITATGENRAPTVQESRTALPYVLEELEILAPRVVICLGLSSAKALLSDPTLKMGQANGAFFDKAGFKVFVTYHPSPYNYKFDDKKEAMRAAFQQLKASYSSPE